MDPLTQYFNAQAADWSIRIAPLLMLLILDDIEQREKRRRDRISRLDRRFNAQAINKSRMHYARQIATPHASKCLRM